MRLPLLLGITLFASTAQAQLPQRWQARYGGPLDTNIAHALAVDSNSGHVYVTGESAGDPTTGTDYFTVAYDADGTQLWAARYTSSGNNYDRALAIAVDPNLGNVYVTGESASAYATVAYDRLGNQLWAARYRGPIDLGGFAHAIAVDPRTGNVYVTGTVVAAHFILPPPIYGVDVFDYGTVAYNAANGNPLWVSLYEGPAKGNSSANALAVNPRTGNVYVTTTLPSLTTRVEGSCGRVGITVRVILKMRRSVSPWIQKRNTFTSQGEAMVRERV
jgi:hypothetical protein